MPTITYTRFISQESELHYKSYKLFEKKIIIPNFQFVVQVKRKKNSKNEVAKTIDAQRVLFNIADLFSNYLHRMWFDFPPRNNRNQRCKHGQCTHCNLQKGVLPRSSKQVPADCRFMVSK